jgi:hypothetical protein
MSLTPLLCNLRSLSTYNINLTTNSTKLAETTKCNWRVRKARRMVHLKFPEIKVGASGRWVKEVHEVQQHPKGHKDRHVVTFNRQTCLQNLQSLKEMLLASDGGKGVVSVAMRIA